jgi:hypothetical protein
LTIEDYRKLTAPPRNLAEILACPEAENIDFEPGRFYGAPLAVVTRNIKDFEPTGVTTLNPWL